MFGFNIDDLSSLVSRMEGVARSMANSVERMEDVADKMNPPKPLEIQLNVHLDGKKIHEAIRRYGDDERSRR